MLAHHAMLRGGILSYTGRIGYISLYDTFSHFLKSVIAVKRLQLIFVRFYDTMTLFPSKKIFKPIRLTTKNC